MVRNMQDLAADLLLFLRCRDHVGKVSLIDFDVHSISCTEGRDLHVVPISAAPRHLLQMALENPFHLFGGGGQIGSRPRICPNVLSFWIPPDATTRVHVNELFVVRCIVTHVVDHARTDFMVRGLIAVELVGKSIEETIA